MEPSRIAIRCSIRLSVFVASVVALLAFGAAAHADDGTRLSRADVEALTADKELKYERADGSPVAWDFHKDGSVYYTPRNAKRNIIIGGTYAVDDDGGLCLKWREDKYVTLTDGCYVFTRADGKTRISRKRDPDSVLGTLQ